MYEVRIGTVVIQIPDWLALLLTGVASFGLGVLVGKLIDPPQVRTPEEYKQLVDKYVNAWKQAGIPQETIDLALKWAQDWSSKLANALIPEPSVANEVATLMYPSALKYANKWIEGITGKQINV